MGTATRSRRVRHTAGISRPAHAAARRALRAAAATALPAMLTAGCSLVPGAGRAPTPEPGPTAGPHSAAAARSVAAPDPALDYSDRSAVCDLFTRALLTVDASV